MDIKNIVFIYRNIAVSANIHFAHIRQGLFDLVTFLFGNCDMDYDLVMTVVAGHVKQAFVLNGCENANAIFDKFLAALGARHNLFELFNNLF